MRIGSISAYGNVKIEFTSTISLPDTSEFIEINELRDHELLNIKMLSGGEDGGFDENLTSWNILSVSSTLISVDLEFQKPLEVSMDDQPDMIAI